MISSLPWWAKLSGKLVLARLPISYDFWRRVGLFRHGEMNHPQRAIATFANYYNQALKYRQLGKGFHSLEVGPGDSILSGIVARAYGASEAWLVDAGNFADTSVEACKETVSLLAKEGKQCPDIENAATLHDVLKQTNVNYLINGTQSLATIPDETIDFFWSQVVLEHVPLKEFPKFLKELRRVVSPDAIGVHSIDFRDHLSGGLNNLRFSEQTWESDFFRNSGFYTNRIRPNQMINLFKEAGFKIESLKETRWPSTPIDRRSLATSFSHLPDDELQIAEIEIVIRPI